MEGYAWIKPAVIIALLAVLWTLEGVVPEFVGRRDRLGHGWRNVALGLLNAAVSSLLLAGVLVAAATWAERRGFGLLHLLSWPAWVEWPAAIIAFDLWMYLWHRANHRVPVLWRFHSVHHTDAELDATSALRFHTGEILLSGLARLAVLPLLGMTAGQLLAYELILQPVILFHHSNVRIPAVLDRGLRGVIVTPWMHWVHHSDWQPETDSNYGSVFSWWDRLGRTFRLRRDPGTLRLGLKGYDPTEWRELRGMLLTPFRRRRAEADDDTDRDGERVADVRSGRS